MRPQVTLDDLARKIPIQLYQMSIMFASEPKGNLNGPTCHYSELRGFGLTTEGNGIDNQTYYYGY